MEATDTHEIEVQQLPQNEEGQQQDDPESRYPIEQFYDDESH